MSGTAGKSLSAPDRQELSALAKLMVQRHLQLCLDKRLRTELSEYVGHLVEPERGSSRVIALVGAGASAPVFDRGRDIAIKLQRKFASGDLGYEAEIRRLVRVYNFDPDAMETVLFALSRTTDGATKVRQELSDIYKRRHPTLLTNEILAHLLKHRFLDAIISFNFDELLDQSLDDELGESEYIRVISERDCERIGPDHWKTKRAPVYVKLHGTASDPDTLKFSRDSYYAMGRRMERLVRSLLGSHRCTIVNVGFGMRSFDFTQLLERPKMLSIFNLSYDKFTPAALKEIEDARRGQPQAEFSEIPASSYLPSGGRLITGTDVLLGGLGDLIDDVCRATKGIAEFRTTTRHHLVSAILDWGPEAIVDRAQYADYLEDRTTLEVAISAIKSRGLLTMASLVEERCAKYFDRVWRELPSPPSWTSNDWLTTCRRGGLEPSRISNETFVSLEEIRATAALRPGETIDETELDNLAIDAEKLCGVLKPHLHIPSQMAWDRYGQLQVLAALRELQSGTEVEVHVAGDKICSKVFQKPEYLPTTSSFQARTIHMLARQQVDRVAVVAETGQWLLEEPYRSLLKGKAIYIIVAFSKDVAKLEDAFPGIHIMPTHWWRHNRHMTIACEKDTALAGIYFQRRQRSLVVSPVYIEYEADRRTLLSSFFAYWERSRRMPNALRVSDIPKSFKELRVPSESEASGKAPLTIRKKAIKVPVRSPDSKGEAR